MAFPNDVFLLATTILLLNTGVCDGSKAKGKDSSPFRFTHHLYNTTIKENSAPRTYVETPVKMGIQLADSSWDIKYSLVTGDGDGLFQVESLTIGDICFLRIQTRRSNSALLNREVRDSYVLTVEATESTHDFKAKTKVSVLVLDTNDLKPLFLPASYNVAIREDTPLRTSVARVSATDADIGSNAQFYYSFTSRAHPFSVDPFTGIVSLAKKLNYSRSAHYQLTILAEDRTKKISGVQKFGNVARVSVKVQKANIASPVIPPVGKPVILADGKISVSVLVEAGIKPVESLSIVGGDPHKCFEIVPAGVEAGRFQLISTKRIMWHQFPFGLNLSLQAKDSSSPPLPSSVTVIHIPQDNSTRLAFLEDTYIVTLSEFSPLKTHVVMVSVNPGSINVTFSIKNNPDSKSFKINPKTGIIVTTKKFDYERKNRYEFDVMANHGQAETHVVVEITDENDNSPTFSQISYKASVAENGPVGSSVIQVVAEDQDKGKNGIITYAIANTDTIPFTIDPFTGLISTSEHLDYERMKRVFHLRVWALDSGSPFSHVSECAVTITMSNANDNIPLLERVGCNSTVPLDLPVGNPVVELSAIDLDELNQLSYVIESGNELQLFSINSVTGLITLNQPINPVLVGHSLSLRVRATDGKHHSEPSVVSIILTEEGTDATIRCQETGISRHLKDQLIESIKPGLMEQDEESYSDVHIINKHSPRFESSMTSSIDLSEDYPLNSTIVKFMATDYDTGFNSKLVYAISSGNEDGCFSISTFSGELQLVCPLDRESREFYILNITVYDLGIPQTSSWKFMAVNVLDVNDNAPIFDQPRYVVRVLENTEVDVSVFKAHAVDLDSEARGTIQYSLRSSSEVFKVDGLTGEIRVTANLDRESTPRYDLQIEARDQADVGQQLYSTMDLVVVLQDVNDNPPKFVPRTYKIKVPEDVPVGTVLVWVDSVDLDQGSGGLITYNLKNTESGIFNLDASTGSLTLEKELDFERRPSYNLTVRAVDHGLPRSLSSSCFVEIQVLDVNENIHRPTFSEFVYEAAVMEDAAVGTSVLTLTASDKDLGRDGTLRYHIQDGSGLGVFTIDEETGVISTTAALDREAVPNYWLSAYVTDLGTEPLASWTHVFLEVLDVNDNPPELSQPVYSATIPENAAKARQVLQLHATDADSSSEGKLSYHMLESQRTYFDIQPKTGVILTLAELDREDKEEHTIEVIVSDHGSPALSSTATVIIRVLDQNDNRPKFTDKLFHITLPEQRAHANTQEACRMVARDDDAGTNAEVTYSLHDNTDDRFQVDPRTGAVTSQGPFWAGNYSILTIKATDGGRPSQSSTARLDVEWVAVPTASSEPMTFDEPQFTFAVMETEPVTHMVGIIMTETHRLRWFTITGGDEDHDFDIQRNMGTILIARRLDAARRSNYNLTVSVTDGHHTATTQAYIRVIDMNQHRPAFLKSLYEVRVPEDTSPWKDILQISAEDQDFNSKLVYSIHSSLHPDSLKYFHLDPKSGVLVLTEALDYEDITVHTLVIMVRDQDIPVKRNFARVMVYVEDCNDHSPIFLRPRFEAILSNMAATGSQVIQVKALDKDTGSNADIAYSLHSGNIDHLFSIDQVLGSISLTKPLDLHPQEKFQLTVKATDQGFPQRSDVCSIHISVLISEQTPPAFTSEEYFVEISELSSPGSLLVTISASSPAAVHYGVKSGDPNRTFQMNPYTGSISVLKHLDFEKHDSYKLRVTASTSAGALSEAVVHVYVIDENDNAPVFQQREYRGQISEAAHVNSMVMGEGNTPLVIQALDADRDSNSLLVYHIVEPEALNVFKIDLNMGTLSLASPVDFEAKAVHHFSVQVKDSGEPSRYAEHAAKVTVHIMDLNDSPPQFTAPEYEASIIFPAVTGTEVLQISAVDADSEISYFITEGNLHDAFSIHPKTGVISVIDSLEYRPLYELVVKATDGLYKDSAIVKVHLFNLTASGLGFREQSYSARVLENQSMVKTLAALRPTGCHRNEPLVFTVLNPKGRFTISQTSGILETTGVPFDREEQDMYEVVVEVRDLRVPPRRTKTQVKVYIDDVNDNAPQFLNLPFSMLVSEDSEPGDVLYQAMANDRDLGENKSIIYSLEEDFGLFRIDPRVGDVSLQRPLDFDVLNKYVLTILAEDNGEPSHSTTAQLSIQLRNRTNPVFQTLLYPLKVPENVPPFTTILHVQARNPEGYRLIYSLEEDNSTKHFHIDFKTGVLTVTNPLDYESQSMHVLTVRATDSVTGAFSEASVEIEVEDVNDNAPIFSKLPFSVDIPEGLPVGSSVLQVFASDRDSERNKDLMFQMVKTEGNETDFFELDPDTGLIVNTQILDHETTKQFHLKIKVTDNGTVPLSTEANVVVNVTDVNDNPPNFADSQYDVSLDEMAKCGHIVIKIQGSDPDDKDLNDLKYRILSGNEARHFNINESSGLISFSNVCKRNLNPYYNLTVAVSDGVFQNTAPVNIEMMNSNRHSPYFKQNLYEAELAENADAGTRVIRLAAIDPDDGPYGSVDYTIINKLADDKFAIDSNGQIITTQPLDRENPTQRVVAIKVMAKDGGGRVAFCTVKIILTDENDNAPLFKATEYQVSIQSTVNKGSPVIQIMAYDADEGKNADVTYMVDEAEEVTEDIIEVNPFTGVVSIKESLVGMENKIFNFKVKARDGGLPFYNSTVPLQVTVVAPEVPLPKFTEPLYTFSAAEDVPVGTEIGIVRANSDTPLIYSLVNGNTVDSNKDKVFSLDQESGTLLVEKTIDHERTKWYQIDVLAQGNHNGTEVASLVSVNIQVQDVNDNQPVFEANPYRAYLAENMPAGTTVIQVTANDPDMDINGQVTYSLEPAPGGNPAVNDVFSIDGDSGWITVARPVDCEAARLYRFLVVATDHGGDAALSSSVAVEVTVTDENDNAPHFTEDVYRGSTLENRWPSGVIASMTTTDADVSLENRLVTCYITDGDPMGQFAIIQEEEGEWGLILKEPLDREAKDRYTLQITATDGKFQALATAEVHVLDVNDNSPECQQLVYTEVVMENSPSNVFILKVSASDRDTGAHGLVSYGLHGPDADKFHLNQQTGELFTMAVLDREQEMEHNLVVKATDGGGSSCQADILLMIRDMNDNPPRFSSHRYEVTVFDNTTVRTPLAVLYAKDTDTGINSEVRYTLVSGDGGYFSLDEFSGILRLERPLSPETRPAFELQVKAWDRGLPHQLSSVATVTVNVVSLDDYQPVFLSSEYTAQLPESLAVGSEVLSVSALGSDAGGPDRILYSIVSGNEDGRFLLDQHAGLLTLARALDYEVHREYYISIEGTRGRAGLGDSAMVIVNVTDVNDNVPVFQRATYSAHVPESLTPGNAVLQVVATDRDGPLHSLLRYSIVDGDPRQQFSIHQRSGEISTRTGLDREQTPHYSLTVQAADEGHPPLSTAVQVTVTVGDVNDNAPAFSHITHNLLLQEGEAVGSGVLQLRVSDQDEPKNGPPFSFHIVSGNEDRRFQVDQGGLLSLAAPLRKKVRPRHQLKIQVTDSGHPPLSSICVVNVNVTEQSRYPPSLVPLEVFITTKGGLFANRVIGRLHASDQDPQDVLAYSLVSESPAGARFSVERADGKIWADEALEPGSYALNVSVTDGKFSVWTGVKVHVWVADQRVLDAGLTLQLLGMTPGEFLGDHWRGLQRSLGVALGVPRQELHLASLQHLPHSQVLEALLTWRSLDGSVQSLPTTRLAGIISDLEDSLGLSIQSVSHNGCLGTGCPSRGCRNAVRLAGDRLNHYTTARASFITPHHAWESVCPCNGSALRFTGGDYVRYLHHMDEDSQAFRLSLRFRTFQKQGLLMATNASDWGTLQLTDGELQFQYRCGNGLPGSLVLRAVPASDGRWHHLQLVVNSTRMWLTLDHKHTASNATEPCRMMRSHGALLLASASPDAPADARGLPPAFIGCLEGLEFNGQPVEAGDAGQWAGPGLRRVFGAYQCCNRLGGCSPGLCLNEGVCEETAEGEPQCRCPGNHHGPRCSLADNPCLSQPCTHGAVCTPKPVGYFCNCSQDFPGARCHNLIDGCSPSSCGGGHGCKFIEGYAHCDPLPLVSTMIGMVEIMEICACLLGLLLLVAGFVCVRKRYVSHNKKKPNCVQDSNGYSQPSLTKSMMKDPPEGYPMEMSSLAHSPTTNDLDSTPFRSLRPRSQIISAGCGVPCCPRPQGPVVCSVAPNLPARPPSSSDNDSIRKNQWDMDYEVYPADPDYFGHPAARGFPQFDIVEDAYSTGTTDSRRNSRFGGFPFPLERSDRRAPLPPCYSNQNLDDFLGPDGLPLPRAQCPNEYTAVSYYPSARTRSLDNVSGGYKRLSMRLSMAMPSYAEDDSLPPLPSLPSPPPPPPPINGTKAQTRPVGQTPRVSYGGSDLVESDYGSSEEVMF
ncbi:protocadherin Fat 2 [Gadus chalcogrammus]|uniref:protocadherin Fat 2 n=1 Tax=Gadus chalcogrammus TaxID=1042646 RepID=UPI0024C4B4E5|nr:protocadherin Fat 2 [Gadus chalcogrammus]